MVMIKDLVNRMKSALVTRWKRGGVGWRPEKRVKADAVPSSATQLIPA